MNKLFNNEDLDVKIASFLARKRQKFPEVFDDEPYQGRHTSVYQKLKLIHQ